MMELSRFKEYKSKNNKFKVEQSFEYLGNKYWNWAVWIDAPEKDLDKIEKVIYNLHYTFFEPVQIIENRKSKFKLETSGWGVFTIYVSINFKDKSILELKHDLQLEYPDGRVNND